MTGAQLYRIYTRVFTGAALPFGALSREEREKWRTVAEEASRPYEVQVKRLQERIATLRWNAGGGEE